VKQLKDRPFALIGVNIFPQSPADLKKAMRREKLTWRSFTVKDTEITRIWNKPATPSYYIIDHDGIIRYKWVGNPGSEAIDRALEGLLKAAEGN